jgi:hypothetical protein
MSGLNQRLANARDYDRDHSRNNVANWPPIVILESGFGDQK